jgi:hypothetical protein
MDTGLRTAFLEIREAWTSDRRTESSPIRSEEPFNSPDWIFETKLDGYRAIAVINATGTARLWSRNRLPLEPKFSTLGDAVNQLELRSTILDGEIVALDDDGIPRKWESMLVLALAERSDLESPTRTLVKVGEPPNATNTAMTGPLEHPYVGVSSSMSPSFSILQPNFWASLWKA